MARRMSPLAAAAASGDRLALLRELRSKLVDAIDEVTCTRDLEPLTRRVDVTSEEIDELAGQREPQGTVLEEIRARREARRRKGQAVSFDHSVERGTTRHG